ncbi:MAG TPA: histidine--tRNA ligase [Gammaproteobacteria bacterium]|nr:histidine--tRNA ligase [Gammaproteobacteria bacterium]
MNNPIKAVRGMNDVLPAAAPAWQALEAAARELLATHGYAEIRMPVVEPLALFRRGVGAGTDIVEKEMYEFTDRSGDALALRPEGTASCVRAVLEHRLLRERPMQRLWYGGPMFRHERPQAGRYRQFHQIGVEAFGMASPAIDAEVILLGARLWSRLGLSGLRLEINTLGDPEARAAWRERLVDYFRAHESSLDEDSRRRLTTNPLRILDSKNPNLAEIIAAAPGFGGFLDAASREHFEALLGLLDNLGIECRINPRLVRGLDYYNRTVFEWITDELGAQGTVCAGGRYDGLIAQFGGQPTPAVGCAFGLERLLALMSAQGGQPGSTATADVYLVSAGEAALAHALTLADRLRAERPGLRVQVDCAGGPLGKQFRRADQSGARVALVLGEEELAQGSVTLKALREEGGDQQQVAETVLATHLDALLVPA